MLHDSYDLLICQVALVSSNDMAEQRLAADCLQRTLRFRFRQQLKAGVIRLILSRGAMALETRQ